MGDLLARPAVYFLAFPNFRDSNFTVLYQHRPLPNGQGGQVWDTWNSVLKRATTIQAHIIHTYKRIEEKCEV